MSNVDSIDVPDRPKQVSLINAIEGVIEEVATGHMTPLEVLGVLDHVSKHFWEKNLNLMEDRE